MRSHRLIPFLALALALLPSAGCREVGKFAAKKVAGAKPAREAATRTGREVSERVTARPFDHLLDLVAASPHGASRTPVRPVAPLARMAAPPAAIPEERVWANGADVPGVVPELLALQRRQQEQQAQWEMEVYRHQQLELLQAPYAPHPR